MNKIELLAPAGSMEALIAAVENGADAVYMGGTMFSARQYANNFNYDEICKAVDYAHKRGVKVYVAVNTLVSNNEIEKLIPYLYQLAEAQVDALIVQDLGVANVIRKALPEMELHGSTQMVIHNSKGAKLLENMGFKRVVLAREVSLEDIKLIKENTSIELETFVHGALCICYSGQCLMSSMIGGRSGNRGRCAQPCRLKYNLVDRKGNIIKESLKVGEHLLSPKDLNMIKYLPNLIKAGIVSLKIEGRMKRPEYVATVVKNYRLAIDEYYKDPSKYNPSQEMQKELEQIFNRDFTTGYYFKKQGFNLMSYTRPNNRGLFLGRVVKVESGRVKVKLNEHFAVGDGYEIWVTKGGRIAGEAKELFLNNKKVSKALPGQEIEFKISGKPRVGDRVFKTYDYELYQKARESYLSPKVERKLNLFFKVEIEEGKNVKISAWDEEGYSVTCLGTFIVEKAKKYPLDYDTLYKQLSRLGNTPFELKNLEANIKGKAMVPLSELNKLRRKIIDDLLMLRKKELIKEIPLEKDYYQKVKDLVIRIPPQQQQKEKPLLSVLVGDLLSLKKAVDSGADIIYINFEGLKSSKKALTIQDLREGVEYCHSKNKKLILRFPRIVHEKELKDLDKKLKNILKLDFDGYLVGNLGIFQMVKELKLKNIYVDYTLNIFNDLTIQKLSEYEIVGATLSPELTLEQIKEFNYLGNLPLEVIVHGNFPLMISEYCAIGSILGNKKGQNPCQGICTKEGYGLKDRMNFIFPIETDEYCRMLIYNSKPLNLYKDIDKIFKIGIDMIRIEGRKENPKWIEKVTSVYRQAIEKWVNNKFYPDKKDILKLDELEPNGYTTGHFFRGVL